MKYTKAILDIAYPEIEKCTKNKQVGKFPTCNYLLFLTKI